MVAKAKSKNKVEKDVDSRQLLLQAAKKVFAEKGLEGATVKDIGDLAGLNVSLVSYYFKGKEGIYRACLEDFGGLSSATAERVLKTPQSAEDFRTRLQIFAEEFINLHLSERDICKILHRDFESPNPITQNVFKNSFVPIYLRLVEFVRAGQSKGFVHKNLNPDIITALIFGSLVEMIRMDNVRRQMMGDCLLGQRSQEKTIAEMVRILTNGIFVEKLK